jgi:uncharacterized membrane protein YozB (DUF420 family)
MSLELFMFSAIMNSISLVAMITSLVLILRRNKR